MFLNHSMTSLDFTCMYITKKTLLKNVNHVNMLMQIKNDTNFQGHVTQINDV